MRRVAFYLLLFLAMLTSIVALDLQGRLPDWLRQVALPFRCVLAGGFGGCAYCLRAVYLNACVKKKWDHEWHPWYYIRPFVSMVCGGASFVFLRAGLLVLESNTKTDATQWGFIALAFVAGLNVDKFVTKIEEIAQAVWGIEKSRTSKSSGDAD